MICDVCGVDIPRGQRYNGKRYKTNHFCSQECYDAYLLAKAEERQIQDETKARAREEKARQKREEKQRQKDMRDNGDGEYRKFLDLLNATYPEDCRNFPLWQRQASNYMEKFGLDYSQLRGIIVYALMYDNHQFDPKISLTQFFPRYIEPFYQFMEKLKANKTFVLPEEETVEIERDGNRTNYNVKAVDF